MSRPRPRWRLLLLLPVSVFSSSSSLVCFFYPCFFYLLSFPPRHARRRACPAPLPLSARRESERSGGGVRASGHSCTHALRCRARVSGRECGLVPTCPFPGSDPPPQPKKRGCAPVCWVGGRSRPFLDPVRARVCVCVCGWVVDRAALSPSPAPPRSLTHAPFFSFFLCPPPTPPTHPPTPPPKKNRFTVIASPLHPQLCVFLLSLTFTADVLPLWKHAHARARARPCSARRGRLFLRAPWRLLFLCPLSPRPPVVPFGTLCPSTCVTPLLFRHLRARVPIICDGHMLTHTHTQTGTHSLPSPIFFVNLRALSCESAPPYMFLLQTVFYVFLCVCFLCKRKWFAV